MTRLDFRCIRHSQVIEDPFPEYTRVQSTQLAVEQSYFEKLIKKRCPLPEIKPHAAYMKGYNKAYEEIEAALVKKGIICS
jgi:hypothetical protein